MNSIDTTTVSSISNQDHAVYNNDTPKRELKSKAKGTLVNLCLHQQDIIADLRIRLQNEINKAQKQENK